MTGTAPDRPGVAPGAIVAVDDPGDPRLEPYRNLKDPAGRTDPPSGRPVVVVEGKLAVERLLTSPYPVRSLLVDDRQVTAAGDLVAAVAARGAPVFVGTPAVVAATVGFALHRGIVAVAARRPPAGAGPLLARAARRPARPGAPPLVAVLEGLNDHENIGSLFRNAAAFGVAGVLLDPTCADPLYRRSIRVSVGHVLHLPFARLEPWPDRLDQVRAAGFVVAALAPGRARDAGVAPAGLAELQARVARSDPPAGVALLLGAEGSGLSASALGASDTTVAIPMADGVDSLNVAVAAAVAFHVLAGL